VTCVEGEKVTLPEAKAEERFSLRDYWLKDWQQGDEHEAVTLVETEVFVANISPDLLKALLEDPNEIYNLSPETFELLICDRLQEMGFGVSRVGKHSYHKDGGIDIVAWSEGLAVPFLLAIQAKHHRSPKLKTGPNPIRELQGVLQHHPFNAGVLITNTTFTPDAEWVAQLKPMLVRLRDIHDIRRWLENNFLDEQDWREIPEKIEVCPGVIVQIPKPKIYKL
jgi:hypothetical protein